MIDKNKDVHHRGQLVVKRQRRCTCNMNTIHYSRLNTGHGDDGVNPRLCSDGVKIRLTALADQTRSDQMEDKVPKSRSRSKMGNKVQTLRAENTAGY